MDVNAIIDNLAAKLSVPVAMLWQAVMRQAIISSVADLVFIVFIGILIFLHVKYVQLVHRKTTDDGWDDIAWLPVGIATVVLLVLVCISMAGLPMTIAGFFNPQYWALHDILGSIHK